MLLILREKHPGKLGPTKLQALGLRNFNTAYSITNKRLFRAGRCLCLYREAAARPGLRLTAAVGACALALPS